MKMAKRKLSLRKRILLNNKKVKKLKSKKVIKVGYFYYLLFITYYVSYLIINLNMKLN